MQPGAAWLRWSPGKPEEQGDTTQEKSEEIISKHLTDESFYALNHCLEATLISTECTLMAITKKLKADKADEQ